VVDRGATGSLVAPRDVEALADAIAAIATDSDRRAAMGHAAIAKARAEFDDRRIIETTLATYDRVLAHSKRRGNRR
jgi:glycosyltransferase involved in cell wall biosynthesis